MNSKLFWLPLARRQAPGHVDSTVIPLASGIRSRGKPGSYSKLADHTPAKITHTHCGQLADWQDRAQRDWKIAIEIAGGSAATSASSWHVKTRSWVKQITERWIVRADSQSDILAECLCQLSVVEWDSNWNCDSFSGRKTDHMSMQGPGGSHNFKATKWRTRQVAGRGQGASKCRLMAGNWGNNFAFA